MVTPTSTVGTTELRLAVDADLGAGIRPGDLLSAVTAILDVVRLQLAIGVLGALTKGLQVLFVSHALSATQTTTEDISAELWRYGLTGAVDPAELQRLVEALPQPLPADVRSALADHIGRSEQAMQRLLVEVEDGLTVESLVYRNPLEIMLIIGSAAAGAAGAAKAIVWLIKELQEMRQRALTLESTRLDIRKKQLELAAEEDKQRDAVVRRLSERAEAGSGETIASILVRSTIHVAIAAEIPPDNPLVIRGAAALEDLPTEVSARLEN